VAKNEDFGSQCRPRPEQPGYSAPDEPEELARRADYQPIRGMTSAVEFAVGIDYLVCRESTVLAILVRCAVRDGFCNNDVASRHDFLLASAAVGVCGSIAAGFIAANLGRNSVGTAAAGAVLVVSAIAAYTERRCRSGDRSLAATISAPTGSSVAVVSRRGYAPILLARRFTFHRFDTQKKRTDEPVVSIRKSRLPTIETLLDRYNG
jgi:hypothetical protein